MVRTQHILLADDDADDSSLFQEALQELHLDHIFSHVEDGEQLLIFLSIEDLPDIIFLDLNMPGKNGLECLQEIRAISDYDNIPVVIYSTSSGKRDIDACYAAGANFYIIKPDNFPAIISRLKKLFDANLNAISTTSKEQFVL